MKKNTSRDALFDAIEYLFNQIAIASHCQELINNKYIDYETEVDDILAAGIKNEISDLEELLKISVKMRRDMMLQIKSEWDCNHEMWCLVKHGISSYGYAVELWYAYFDTEQESFYKMQVQDSAEQMIKILSKFLKVDGIVSCGRCMLDMLEKKI